MASNQETIQSYHDFLKTLQLENTKHLEIDELYLIIGEDSYKEFKTWTRWNDILHYVTLAVANRGKNIDSKLQESVPAISINMGKEFEDCSATNCRNRLIEELMDMYLADKEWYINV